MNRLLFVHLRHINYFWESLFYGLENYRTLLLRDYPQIKRWVPEDLFEAKPIWPDAPVIDYQWESEDKGKSITGEFIAVNLETPTDIMYGYLSAKKVIEKLENAKKEGFPYTHVGFSIFIAAYNKFIECAQAVKKFDNSIITIAGNAGVLFPGTEKYVDYVCKGDGIPFLRELLGEDINKPYVLKSIPQNVSFSFYGIHMKMKLIRLVTKLGCPNKCDFCITHQLYEGKSTKPFFTPQQVHDELIKYWNQSKKEDLIIFFCEPQAIINRKWWYELFELFENEPGEYPITLLTTLKSIKDFDLDRISKSSLRLSFVNLGIESFSQEFSKNTKYQETKSIIKRLIDYGIGTYASFIIGFDHQTHEIVWEEIKNLVNLDIAQIEVFNLKPLPQTPLWNFYNNEGRLLDIPFDFYYLPGFQPFTHPHFKPGFEDMLPLLYEIYEYYEKERGTSVLKLLELYQNIPNQNKKLQKTIKYLKLGANVLYPSWKKYLNPNDNQIENYIRRLGQQPKIPSYLKLYINSPKLQKLASFLTK